MDIKRIRTMVHECNLRDLKDYLDSGGVIEGYVNDYMPILLYAIEFSYCVDDSKRDEFISSLIHSGADVNATHRHAGCSTTPLMSALETKRGVGVIRDLLNAGSDVNARCEKNKTPLIYALEKNSEKSIIAELIQRGADVNYKVPGIHWTPLFYAVHYNNNFEIVKLLLEAGANVKARENVSRRNVLMMIGCRSCEGSYCKKFNQTIKYFLNEGIDIKDRDHYGNTVIHLVSCSYLIRLAMSCGVSIESKNRRELTPLLYAMESCLIRQLNTLLLFGASPNCILSNGNGPLFYVSVVETDEVIRLLFYHGGDLFVRNFENRTPLEVLCAVSDTDIGNISVAIKEIIKHYLIFVGESSVDGYFESSDGGFKRQFSSYTSSCKQELTLMKNSFVKDGLTYYQFCTQKKLFKSKLIDISADEFITDYETIRKSFPLYKNIIISRIKDNQFEKFSKVLRDSLEKVIVNPIEIGNNEINMNLSFDTLYYISSYLNNKHLFRLFLAAI